MGLTNKRRKKLTAWIFKTDGEIEELRVERMCEYFALMLVVLFWDTIAGWLYIRHASGIGWGQWLIVVVLLALMRRQERKLARVEK